MPLAPAGRASGAGSWLRRVGRCREQFSISSMREFKGELDRPAQSVAAGRSIRTGAADRYARQHDNRLVADRPGPIRRAHQHSALADLQLAARISAPAKQRRAQRAPGAVETDLQDCAYSSAQNAARSLMLKTQRLFAVGLFGGLSMNCTLGTICTCGNSCSR